jgi:hypothetical protein
MLAFVSGTPSTARCQGVPRSVAATDSQIESGRTVKTPALVPPSAVAWTRRELLDEAIDRLAGAGPARDDARRHAHELAGGRASVPGALLEGVLDVVGVELDRVALVEACAGDLHHRLCPGRTALQREPSELLRDAFPRGLLDDLGREEEVGGEPDVDARAVLPLQLEGLEMLDAAELPAADREDHALEQRSRPSPVLASCCTGDAHGSVEPNGRAERTRRVRVTFDG